MILPRRPLHLSALLRQRVPATFRSSIKPQFRQQLARRGYASEGGHSAKASSDLPWAIGAFAVTAPSVWWLLQPDPNKESHGHGHEGGGHGKDGHEEHEEHEEASEQKDGSGEGEKTEKSEGESEDKDSDSSSDSDSEQGKGADTPDTSDEERKHAEDPDNQPHETESGGDIEGVKFKGSTKDGEAGDTRKHIPDAKGGKKKRIESDLGKKQGEQESGSGDDDNPAPSKESKGGDTISGKQEGLSNTNTKHSTDLTNNPEKSRKGEGGPDTAKVKGTVKTDRPTPEMRGKDDK
ncbi:MAG: hypothetical protein MMC33_005192 [Icmadophila ericetorum]|nr:hypothetical protein [Icmadophila ericetorum]